uniref:NAC domain-containing protein n=1 Tax=Nelumbo nucifera TaxID=4432 RepID=A0A822ZPH0_NELNU|nr:TPA_asm: hypothetical protein HUJ06_003469 [Nelumbo nucifera]
MEDVSSSSPTSVKSPSKTSDSRDDFDFSNIPPGFRFTPSDEELVVFYLQKMLLEERLPANKIEVVSLYDYSPQALTEKHKPYVRQKEWYFFTHRDRKYRNGSRPNRSAGDGYWKATGADKSIYSNGVHVGYKKALVFYKGKPPKGEKTNWIMHEYRIAEYINPRPKEKRHDMRLDDFVLCKIYKKPEKSATTRVAGDPEKAKVDGEAREISNNYCDLDIPYTQSSFYDEYISMHKEDAEQNFYTNEGIPDQPLQHSNLEYRQNFPNNDQRFTNMGLLHGSAELDLDYWNSNSNLHTNGADSPWKSVQGSCNDLFRQLSDFMHDTLSPFIAEASFVQPELKTDQGDDSTVPPMPPLRRRRIDASPSPLNYNFVDVPLLPLQPSNQNFVGDPLVELLSENHVGVPPLPPVLQPSQADAPPLPPPNQNNGGVPPEPQQQFHGRRR